MFSLFLIILDRSGWKFNITIGIFTRSNGCNLNQTIPRCDIEAAFSAAEAALPLRWERRSERCYLNQRKRAIEKFYRWSVGITLPSAVCLSKRVATLLNWWRVLSVFLSHFCLSLIVIIQLTFNFVKSAEKGRFRSIHTLRMLLFHNVQLLCWTCSLVAFFLKSFQPFSLVISIYQEVFRISILDFG